MGAWERIWARLGFEQRKAAASENRVQGAESSRGCNEVQARYGAWLGEEATRRWPGVELAFDVAGCSSNGERGLPTIDGRIREAGAAVVVRLVRTTLGRAAREACGRHARPWVACADQGRESLLGAIGRAVARKPGVDP